MNTSCVAARDLVQRRLDGGVLDTLQSATLADHLAACSSCRLFAQELEQTIGLLERLPAQVAPAAFSLQIIERVQANRPQPRSLPWWSAKLGQTWAPLAAVAGLLFLIYHSLAVRGLSLLSLPAAVGEWVQMIDLSNLSSLASATSLFALSIGAEFLLAVSLVVVAVFAIMGQVIAHPPAIGLAGDAKRVTYHT